MILSLWVAAALAAPPAVRRLSERHYKVPESTLNEASASLNEILQTARVVPYLENDKFAGYQFLYIEKDSWFDKLGFRPKDILTQVNKVVFDNPAKGLMAFQALKNEKRWTVHLRRGKRKLKIRYDVVPASKKP